MAGGRSVLAKPPEIAWFAGGLEDSPPATPVAAVVGENLAISAANGKSPVVS